MLLSLLFEQDRFSPFASTSQDGLGSSSSGAVVTGESRQEAAPESAGRNVLNDGRQPSARELEIDEPRTPIPAADAQYLSMPSQLVTMAVMSPVMQPAGRGQLANPDDAGDSGIDPTRELAVQNPGTQSPDSHSPRTAPANTNTRPAPGGHDDFTRGERWGYRCNLCDKVTVRMTSMRAHILTHDPPRRLFMRSANPKRHNLRRHTAATAASAADARSIDTAADDAATAVEVAPVDPAAVVAETTSDSSDTVEQRLGAAAAATIAMAATTGANVAAITTTGFTTTTTTTNDTGAIDPPAPPLGGAITTTTTNYTGAIDPSAPPLGSAAHFVNADKLDFLPQVADRLRRCRALRSDGSFTPPVTCGPGGDYFGTPILDPNTATRWDALEGDEQSMIQPRYAANFNNFGDPTVDEAFPFHSGCAYLLVRELTARSLTTRDLFAFLRGREIINFIPPVLVSLPSFDPGALPPHWRGLKRFWSSPPDSAHVWTCQITTKLVLPDTLRWILAPFDTVHWLDEGSDTSQTTTDLARRSAVTRPIRKSYATYPTHSNQISAATRANLLPTSNLWILELVVTQLPPSYLSDAEILTVFSTSRELHGRGGQYWRRRCLTDGYACRPGRASHAQPQECQGDAEDATTDWKRLYFCAESQSRRRVDSIVQWIVDSVAAAACRKRPRYLLSVADMRRHPLTLLNPGVRPHDLWYAALDFSLMLLRDDPSDPSLTATPADTLDLTRGLSDAQLSDVKAWVAVALAELDGTSLVEAEKMWVQAAQEPNPWPLPATDRTNWKWFIMKRGKDLGLSGATVERFMDKLGVVY
ncbi:hypothetical protein HK405_004182 [Cladochytrium tenue]|nr:hypothetical protein HK405_004182 [Cladochytrium tenue]